MNRRTVLWGMLAVAILALGMSGNAQQTRSRARASAKEDGFAQFQVITDRNIFDPNRIPVSRRQGSDSDENQGDSAEGANLRGVWITNLESLAFIDSNRAEYSGTPAKGAALGGWKLADIQIDKVILEKDGRRLDWPVGQRIERDGAGNWTLAGAAPSASGARSGRRAGSGASRGNSSGATSSAASESSSSKPAANAPAPSGSGAEELLKKMRERRQREMSK